MGLTFPENCPEPAFVHKQGQPITPPWNHRHPPLSSTSGEIFIIKGCRCFILRSSCSLGSHYSHLVLCRGITAVSSPGKPVPGPFQVLWVQAAACIKQLAQIQHGIHISVIGPFLCQGNILGHPFGRFRSITLHVIMHSQLPGGSWIPIQSSFAETGQVSLKISLPGRLRRGNILRSKKWMLNEGQSPQSGKKPPSAMFLHTGTSHSLMAPVSAGKLLEDLPPKPGLRNPPSRL